MAEDRAAVSEDGNQPVHGARPCPARMAPAPRSWAACLAPSPPPCPSRSCAQAARGLLGADRVLLQGLLQAKRSAAALAGREVAQLKGMAIAAIARMRVHVFVRCVGHGRAERAGRGRGLLACACLTGPTEVALCSQ